VPELGISGIDLTSTYPRGVWGSILNCSIDIGSNQETIRTGSWWVPRPTQPPTCGVILVQNLAKNEAKQGAFECFNALM